MKVINHYDATSVADAASTVTKYTKKSAVMAGGTDLLHQMKGFVRADLPDYIINLKSVSGLDQITSDSSGLKIGAMTTLTSIATNSTITSTYPILSQAALSVATPQIRNIGTIGGNICQEVWCWYYRWEHNLFPCLRKGGATCYASAGDNTYHSIFGGPQGCYAVHPSDMAIALLALGASAVTNKRTLAMSQFFSGLSPGHVLAEGEIVTSLTVPPLAADSKQVFLKNRVRQSFDFATASVGLVASPKSSTVTAASIWLGGVAPKPVEATGSETALKGNAINATVAAAAGAAAIANAVPMTMNSYKKPIVQELVRKAILA
jgi:xanthine dehydrogenase YagS FAD-binding subunit